MAEQQKPPAPPGSDGAEEPPEEGVLRLLTGGDVRSLLLTARDMLPARLQMKYGCVYLVQDDGWLRLAAGIGLDEDILERYQLIAPDEQLPAAHVVRTRVPLYTENDTVYEVFRHIRGRADDTTYVALPLLVDEDCLGALFFRFTRSAPLISGERAMFDALSTAFALRLAHLLSRGGPSGFEEDPRFAQAVRLVEGSTRATRLELAMTVVGAGSFEWGIVTDSLAWDERMCRIFGIEPAEFDGRMATFMNAVHPDDAPMVERAIQESIQTLGDFRVEYRVLLPGGGERWVEGRGRVLPGPDGAPARMVGVAYDHTEERRRREREKAQAKARRYREQVSLELTRVLSQTLTIDNVVDVIISVVVPVIGSRGAIVHITGEDGRLRLVGSSVGCEKIADSFGSVDRFGSSPQARALEAGTAMFYEPPVSFAAAFPGVADRLDQYAWQMLPMTASGRTVGTCMFAFDPDRRFNTEDRIAGNALAGLLAQSVERARVSDQSREWMTELQRAMLPRGLAEIPGLAVASRYLPGSEGLEVGGDWYDVLSLPSGRVGLVIGDVEGHSIRAAAVMGQLRIALLAYAAEGHDPSTLMARCNRLLCSLDTELFATCCYIELDLADGSARAARAGHPHPLLAHPDGNTEEVILSGGPPLGIDLSVEYPQAHFALAPGAALLLYTDGLVERHAQDYDEAVWRIADLMGWWIGADNMLGDEDPDTAAEVIQELADRVVAPVEALSLQEDDIAVLLARRVTLPGEEPSLDAQWQIEDADLQSVSEARQALAAELRERGLEAVADTAELLAAELLSNAALHAGGDLILHARLREGVLRIEVIDGSSGRPRALTGEESSDNARLAMGGRGVLMIDAFADRWGWDPMGDRKTVWFELLVPEDGLPPD